MKKSIFAFTLAEVLITLGIIGVVAAMTIPTLMQKTEKQTSLTRLKHFYSSMFQAIKLSESANGPASEWEYPANQAVGSEALTWFNTYLAPYLKYNKAAISTDARSVVVTLNNGTDIKFLKGTLMDIYVYTNGLPKAKAWGKDLFAFHLMPNVATNTFRPYESGATGTERAKWTTGTNGCTPSGNKLFCAGLIMYDGWEIGSDYPYWN